MFTGIVERTGIVKQFAEKGRMYELILSAKKFDTKLGDSVAVNGCCLTIKKIEDSEIYFDLSKENVKSGDRLKVGDAVVEVTDVPHLGCGKFKKRFGAAALHQVNSPQGKDLHLRGIYARVVLDGAVTVGDPVIKV